MVRFETSKKYVWSFILQIITSSIHGVLLFFVIACIWKQETGIIPSSKQTTKVQTTSHTKQTYFLNGFFLEWVATIFFQSSKSISSSSMLSFQRGSYGSHGGSNNGAILLFEVLLNHPVASSASFFVCTELNTHFLGVV